MFVAKLCGGVKDYLGDGWVLTGGAIAAQGAADASTFYHPTFYFGPARTTANISEFHSMYRTMLTCARTASVR